MKSTFSTQSFNKNTATAQVLLLSPEDKMTLKKQKDIISFSCLGVIVCLIGFAGYLRFFQDFPLYLALCITGSAFLIMPLVWYLSVKRLNVDIDHSVKHAGSARIISKKCSSNAYWLVLDGPFKEMKCVYVNALQYYSVQADDLVYVEVLPKSNAALSLKKLT